jgi:hypothetical protein
MRTHRDLQWSRPLTTFAQRGFCALLLVVALPPRITLAACPADTEALRADITAADQAYQQWKWQQFEQRMLVVREDLACLSEIVSSQDAQEIHWLHALTGATSSDEDLATAALRGLLHLAPDFAPNPEQAPPGSLLHRAWEKAKEPAEDDAGTLALPPGAWFVDGVPGILEFQVGRTAVVQLLEPDGSFYSWYYQGEKLPTGIAALAAAQAESSLGAEESGAVAPESAGTNQPSEVLELVACADELRREEARLMERAAQEWVALEPLLSRTDVFTQRAVQAWYASWGGDGAQVTACGESIGIVIPEAEQARAWLEAHALADTEGGKKSRRKIDPADAGDAPDGSGDVEVSGPQAVSETLDEPTQDGVQGPTDPLADAEELASQVSAPQEATERPVDAEAGDAQAAFGEEPGDEVEPVEEEGQSSSTGAERAGQLRLTLQVGNVSGLRLGYGRTSWRGLRVFGLEVAGVVGTTPDYGRTLGGIASVFVDIGLSEFWLLEPKVFEGVFESEDKPGGWNMSRGRGAGVLTEFQTASGFGFGFGVDVGYLSTYEEVFYTGEVFIRYHIDLIR